jgi:hypothetical protein
MLSVCGLMTISDRSRTRLSANKTSWIAPLLRLGLSTLDNRTQRLSFIPFTLPGANPSFRRGIAGDSRCCNRYQRLLNDLPLCEIPLARRWATSPPFAALRRYKSFAFSIVSISIGVEGLTPPPKGLTRDVLVREVPVPFGYQNASRLSMLSVCGLMTISVRLQTHRSANKRSWIAPLLRLGLSILTRLTQCLS